MSDAKTSVASYAASGTAVVFGLTANEVAAFIGALCAVLTFVVNWWFKYRQLKMIEARVNQPFPNIDLSDG